MVYFLLINSIILLKKWLFIFFIDPAVVKLKATTLVKVTVTVTVTVAATVAVAVTVRYGYGYVSVTLRSCRKFETFTVRSVSRLVTVVELTLPACHPERQV